MRSLPDLRDDVISALSKMILEESAAESVVAELDTHRPVLYPVTDEELYAVRKYFSSQ